MSQACPQEISSNDGVSAIELADSNGGGAVFAGVLDAYLEQGYERGYRRAVADVPAAMLALSGDYLRKLPGADANVRGAIYGFEAHVERYFRSRDGAEFVSEGLGI